MRAGVLRHRVSIFNQVEVSDGHHGFVDSVAPLAARIPAFVEPLRGVALERAMQVDPRASHRVIFRHRLGVKSGQTVRFHSPDGDRDFEIVGPPVDVDERRRELQLLCKEAVA